MSEKEDIEEIKKTLYERMGLCDRMTIVELQSKSNEKTMTKMDETVIGISKAVSEYTGAQKQRSKTTNWLLTVIALILAFASLYDKVLW